MFRKVLIANRGEIALRVIRTLREMRIASVAVYSDADRASRHVRLADEAAHIGPAASAESYLRIDKILDAARRHGADAIHPGYGFLSENAEFAAACADAGLTFIGPSAESIQALGSKTAAREIAIAAGVPVVPGTRGPTTLDQARAFAESAGYPVMLKAVAGGGGKGMRLVTRAADLEPAMRDASSEAERAFKNPDLYVEKAILNPRHIEVQVFGDRHGALVHLGERECSLQRRHQKVVEECPSPLVARHPELREAMGAAAVRAARQAGYYNAGTVEFLVDAERNFYFLEVNTRLQVEHPVTEWVTGLDLVKLQIEVAAGAPLPFGQEDVRWNGWSVECRIYAEDPFNNFFPSPGTITRLTRPAGPGVRIDGCVYPGWTVPLEYDPLLAKLAVWGPDREAAIARTLRALYEYDVGGIKTNIGFFRAILEDPAFRAGDLHTGLIDEFLKRHAEAGADEDTRAVAALVAALAGASNGEPAQPSGGSAWLRQGREALLR